MFFKSNNKYDSHILTNTFLYISCAYLLCESALNNIFGIYRSKAVKLKNALLIAKRYRTKGFAIFATRKIPAQINRYEVNVISLLKY